MDARKSGRGGGATGKWRFLAIAALCSALSAHACSAVSAHAQRDEDADHLAAQVGEYVEQYYARAQSLLVEETVTLQPFAHDFTFQGFARRLVYELRVEWDPVEGSASAVRELISAAGPPLGPPSQPDCLDPRATSPEPLALLLPQAREQFAFSLAGTARVSGRDAVRLDYVPLEPEPVKVNWEKECGQIELPGRIRGRVWADAATSEIVRLDTHLVGMVDIPAPREQRRSGAPMWFTVERADTSIHYEPVTFEDPDEILMLPTRIESLTIIRNSGMPRLRTTRSFANYRRFVTDSRLVR